MKAEERRKEIVLYLTGSKVAVSGTELSKIFKVSRQIIVQDIALIKASGYDVVSTHHGYVLQSTPLAERVFKVYHTSEQTKDELSIIVKLGGTVVDVFVWHKVYGKMTAPLNISSRHHIAQFLKGIRTGKSSELMNVTGGYHYHTVRAETQEILNKIEQALEDLNYIVPEI